MFNACILFVGIFELVAILLIHEIGHKLAYKIIGIKSTIRVSKKISLKILETVPERVSYFPGKYQFFAAITGPIVGIIFGFLLGWLLDLSFGVSFFAIFGGLIGSLISCDDFSKTGKIIRNGYWIKNANELFKNY